MIPKDELEAMKERLPNDVYSVLPARRHDMERLIAEVERLTAEYEWLRQQYRQLAAVSPFTMKAK